MKKLAFLSYETPYAPCGGVAAVMARLPAVMKNTSGLETLVVSPYHHKISKTTALELEWLTELDVPFNPPHSVPVQVGRLLDPSGVQWLFLKAADARFFGGVRHPYDVSAVQSEIGPILQRDALFFGLATVLALHKLDPDADWVLLMQDWEAVTAALAVTSEGLPYRSVITLHNSYDSGGISPARLRVAGLNADRCAGPQGSRSSSVLERALLMHPGPVFTVSQQFARDLTQDPFQKQVMARHLQSLLAERVVGIDNGPFTDLALPSDLLTQAQQGDLKGLIAWKQARKALALRALDEFTSSPETPVWGDRAAFLHDDAPWFVMAGRDDTRQKGYDVAVLAVRKFLQKGGDARFLFFPIPGDEGRDGLQFLKKLAQDYPHQVLALPFIFKQGFTAALQGAAYGMMPSLYEPFGMANEFYLNGTPGVGRATGGIVQQIVPLRSVPSFTPAVQTRTAAFWPPETRPTGFLFRESDAIPSTVQDWQSINRAAYAPHGAAPDRVEERSAYPLVQAMAEGLSSSLFDAVELFNRHPKTYFALLIDGIEHIGMQFAWMKAAAQYLERCL